MIVVLGTALLGIVGKSTGFGLGTGVVTASTGRAAFQDLSTAKQIPNVAGQVPEHRHLGISDADYEAAKSVAPKPRPISLMTDAATQAPSSTPIVRTVNVSGIDQTTYGGFPPDGDISVGPSHVIHTVNFAVDIYNKSGSRLKRSSLATFFNNNSTDFLFDPRTYYDPYWNRFVVIADGKQDLGGGNLQSYWELAISGGADPTLGWYIYRYTGAIPQNNFLDYPQLGMDQDAIIVTGNDARGAQVYALSKARMYTGRGASFTPFTGKSCTLAPPYVLDNNSKSFILMACPNDNKITVFTMTNTSRTNTSLTAGTAISVPAYTVAPNAPQPSVDYAFETGANQFEQRSIQYGNEIWNVMTISAGTATPKWYRLSTSSNTVLNSGLWYASGTSSDYHASITGDGAGRIFGTWMSLDATNSKYMQLRVNGANTGASAGTGAGTLVVQASTYLTGQTYPGSRHRSGDYSGIALDPSNYSTVPCGPNQRAWLEGEQVLDNTNWDTQIARVGFC